MRLGHDQNTDLILRMLVRRLVEKGVLSPDEVRTMLIEATRGEDLVGDQLTTEAATAIVDGDLIPAFLGDGAPKP